MMNKPRIIRIASERVTLGSSPSEVRMIDEQPGSRSRWTPQNFVECFTEIAIEKCIDDWVEYRVEVPHPEQDGDDPRWSGAVFGAQTGREVPGEERQPAD